MWKGIFCWKENIVWLNDAFKMEKLNARVIESCRETSLINDEKTQHQQQT